MQLALKEEVFVHYLLVSLSQQTIQVLHVGEGHLFAYNPVSECLTQSVLAGEGLIHHRQLIKEINVDG